MSFVETLVEFNVLGLTIATIVGIVATTFFKSFVDDVLMPLLTSTFNTQWQDYKIRVGNSHINAGRFLSTLLYVVMALLLVVLFYRLIKNLLDDYKSYKDKKQETDEKIQQNLESIDASNKKLVQLFSYRDI